LLPLVRNVWIFTSCITMGLYRRFGGTWCFQLHENLLSNWGTNKLYYKV